MKLLDHRRRTAHPAHDAPDARGRRIRRSTKPPTARPVSTAFGMAASYDAVVLDQKMPGLDGLETLQRIKERAPDACVLMVTAFASIELAVDAMRLGATDFLRKPMTPETLRGAVAAAIAGKASRRPPGASPLPRPSGPPDIAVLTMNGFQILRAPSRGAASSQEHVFRVKHVADGAEFTVTVADRSRSRRARCQADAPAARTRRARSGVCRPSGCCRRMCGVKAAARPTAA